MGMRDAPFATVGRLVAFYVDEHNRVLPHSAFWRPDAGRDVLRDGDEVPEELEGSGWGRPRHPCRPTDQ